MMQVSCFGFLILINFATTISHQLADIDRKQEQLNRLYKNLFCLRDPPDLSGFDPLQVVDQYHDPQAAQILFEKIRDGKTLPRYLPFFMAGPRLVELKEVFEILYYIDNTERGWPLFYNTSAYLALNLNVELMTWALEQVYSTRFYGIFTSPPVYESLPQLFVDKRLTRAINMDPGLNGTLGEYGSPDDALSYWKLDPRYGSFHQWWHADNQFWWNPQKYGIVLSRKGENFLYTHHNIMARYKAEGLAHGLVPPEIITLNPPFVFKYGYTAHGLNLDLSEISPRAPGAVLQDTRTFKLAEVVSNEIRLKDGIRQGFLRDKAGNLVPLRDPSGRVTMEAPNILGAALEESYESVDTNYYGGIHNSLHGVLADLTGPTSKMTNVAFPGMQAFPAIALQESAFYNIHAYVDDVYQQLMYTSIPREEVEITWQGVDLDYFHVGSSKKPFFDLSWLWPFPSKKPFELTTYKTQFSWDISNVIRDCRRLSENKQFTASQTVLAHEDFEYRIQISSKLPTPWPAVIRIFISPINKVDGKPFSRDELFWNMMELDRIPVTLRPGKNSIRRYSWENLVTGSDGRKERLKRSCGFPLNMLIPKGTILGMEFALFVMISPATSPNGSPNMLTEENEQLFPSLAMCGSSIYPFPDDYPMGYPFDRKLEVDLEIPKKKGNYAFYPLVIKHK